MHAFLRKLKLFTNKRTFSFLAGSVLGIAFFISFFGVQVINPTNTDWLLLGGDLRQHYYGWEFFRDSPWTFPVGIISDLAYPYGIPVTYMDAIPLLAIPFKLFAGLLPDTFQYFGLWGLASFALQGGIAAVLIRRWTSNVLIVLLGATIFIVNPMVISRMFSHTALASHWLILAALWAVIERDKLASTKRQLLTWTGLLALAILIHPYFVPIVGVFFVTSIALTHKDRVSTFVKAALPMLITIGIFWIIGGFAIKESSSDGLGDYAFNLSSLYNPLGWSRFIGSTPISSFSGETLNYLGAGVLTLAPVAIAALVVKAKSFRNMRSLISKLRWPHLVIVAVFVALAIAAISPRVQFGHIVLADIPIPHFVESIWSIFRASARLFWPIYYVITAGILWFIITRGSKKISVALFCIIFAGVTVLQVADIRLSQAAKEKSATFHSQNAAVHTPPLETKPWDQFASDKQHLVYLDHMVPEDFFKLTDVALTYKLTMNTGYFARTPTAKIQAYQEQQREALRNHDANTKDNLYVTVDEKLISDIATDNSYDVAKINIYYIIY